MGGDGFGVEDGQVQAKPLQRTRLVYVSLSLVLPYCLRYVVLGTTLHDVRLELAKEDAADSAQGTVSPHRIALTTFLTTGLGLEAQQYVLHHLFPCRT